MGSEMCIRDRCILRELGSLESLNSFVTNWMKRTRCGCMQCASWPTIAKACWRCSASRQVRRPTLSPSSPPRSNFRSSTPRRPSTSRCAAACADVTAVTDGRRPATATAHTRPCMMRWRSRSSSDRCTQPPSSTSYNITSGSTSSTSSTTTTVEITCKLYIRLWNDGRLCLFSLDFSLPVAIYCTTVNPIITDPRRHLFKICFFSA